MFARGYILNQTHFVHSPCWSQQMADAEAMPSRPSIAPAPAGQPALFCWIYRLTIFWYSDTQLNWYSAAFVGIFLLIFHRLESSGLDDPQFFLRNHHLGRFAPGPSTFSRLCQKQGAHQLSWFIIISEDFETMVYHVALSSINRVPFWNMATSGYFYIPYMYLCTQRSYDKFHDLSRGTINSVLEAGKAWWDWIGHHKAAGDGWGL